MAPTQTIGRALFVYAVKHSGGSEYFSPNPSSMLVAGGVYGDAMQISAGVSLAIDVGLTCRCAHVIAVKSVGVHLFGTMDEMWRLCVAQLLLCCACFSEPTIESRPDAGSTFQPG